MSTCSRRVLAGAIGAVLLAVGGFVAWGLWGPLPQGTPPLSPEMEALRPLAVGYTEAQPGCADDWTLILTHARADYVHVAFENPHGSLPDTRIEVGSSAQVLGCTISVLESHPGRSGKKPGSQTSWALIAVQCPPSQSPNGTATP